MISMALRTDYAGQSCSAARALEVVGERWTLLIIRDAFYGIRRFSDFIARLRIPRAVLTNRLRSLVDEGVLDRVHAPSGHDEYQLTSGDLAEAATDRLGSHSWGRRTGGRPAARV
jgi:DNA-binding HxlR family transcriptional regulator